MFTLPTPSPFPREDRLEYPDAQLDYMAASERQQQAAENPLSGRITPMAHYLTGGGFKQDVNSFKNSATLKTGYKLLDRIQMFCPGLYVMGAVSSLGKTTFSHQAADQVAASGQPVLYFAMEQTAFELTAKSISRSFYRKKLHDTRKANQPMSSVNFASYQTPSALEIRFGRTASYQAELEQHIADYVSMVGDRLYIIDGIFSLTVGDIEKHVELFIKQTKTVPVVVVDYLQIIAPTPIKGRVPDPRTSIDYNLHILKMIQSKYNMVMLVISNLNRQNYMTPVDFESFKESGGIEYTADVIWGLQLSLMTDENFYYHYDKSSGKRKGETSLAEKREMVKQAKAANPRKVDLVCLKNRDGCPSYTVHFDYCAASNFFYPPFDPMDPDTAI